MTECRRPREWCGTHPSLQAGEKFILLNHGEPRPIKGRMAPHHFDLELIARLHADYMRSIAECENSPSPLTDQRVVEARNAYRRELSKLPGWEHLAHEP